MKQYTFFIEITDKRTQNLYRILKRKNLNAFKLNQKKSHPPIEETKNQVFIYSPAKRWQPNEAQTLPSNATVFCGAITPETKTIFENKKINYINFLNNEIYAIKNNNLTAESILALITLNSGKSFKELNCLILGMGRLGVSTALILKQNNIKFSAANYSKERYESAHQFTNNVYLGDSFKQHLKKFNCIINTIPGVLFDETDLPLFKKNTLLMETASGRCIGTLTNGINIISIDDKAMSTKSLNNKTTSKKPLTQTQSVKHLNIDNFAITDKQPGKEAHKNFTYLLAPALPAKYQPIAASKLMYSVLVDTLQTNIN